VLLPNAASPGSAGAAVVATAALPVNTVPFIRHPGAAAAALPAIPPNMSAAVATTSAALALDIAVQISFRPARKLGRRRDRLTPLYRPLELGFARGAAFAAARSYRIAPAYYFELSCSIDYVTGLRSRQVLP